jgi:hypothetical protein
VKHLDTTSISFANEAEVFGGLAGEKDHIDVIGSSYIAIAIRYLKKLSRIA